MAEENKEVPTGPTPGQVATAKALADAQKRSDDQAAADAAENAKAAVKTAAPPVEAVPVFIEAKKSGKPGKAHYPMDLLNAAIAIDARRREEQLGLREPVKGKPAPQLVPLGWTGPKNDLARTAKPVAPATNENPVQPIGSTTDKSGRAISHVATDGDEDAKPKPAAVWSPNAQVATGEGWTTQPKQQ